MSLAGAYEEQNIFAKISRGEIPCTKVFEDEVILSFMDLFPQSRCVRLRQGPPTGDGIPYSCCVGAVDSDNET
jgi:hypothetical protein